MRKTRVYTKSVLAIQTIVTLHDEAAHHLGTVLKARPGDTVILFNGTGGCYESEILSIERKAISLRPLQFNPADHESPLKLTLAQGISRGQHMDYTVQKAVELGVSSIVPLFTEFSNVRLEEERARKRRDHWEKIITAACEQSGRNRLPVLYDAMPLNEWVRTESASLRLLMHPEGGQGLAELTRNTGDITLLCGPEGGLSQKEIEYSLTCGYQKVSVGPRILRTETAAVAAIAVCQALRGDMMYNQA
jgi:16S rRNA (uracil1498-N3)-methyltransferase